MTSCCPLSAFLKQSEKTATVHYLDERADGSPERPIREISESLELRRPSS
jgi:hypothetical protein